MAPPTPLRALLDRFGATGSLLCAVHCAVLPLLLALAPSLGLSVWLGDGVERAVVVFVTLLLVQPGPGLSPPSRLARAWPAGPRPGAAVGWPAVCAPASLAGAARRGDDLRRVPGRHRPSGEFAPEPWPCSRCELRALRGDVVGFAPSRERPCVAPRRIRACTGIMQTHSGVDDHG